VYTGLLLLATPVARVVFSIAAFALERDRMYVGITLVVLAILAYGLELIVHRRGAETLRKTKSKPESAEAAESAEG
jgi:Protein of unknown function (DUF1634)